MSKQKELFANDEIAEAEKTKLQLPPMYKVVLNNDDYTSMEFVVGVLQKFFGMDLDKAIQVMLSVHSPWGVQYLWCRCRADEQGDPRIHHSNYSAHFARQ